jgi:pantoate--beta-alanine ligase
VTVFESISLLGHHLQQVREQGLSIGFVPTMGALHNGHISLISKAKQENDVVISSIFVNPTQFNNPDDLKKYPKSLEKDSKMLQEAGCDLLFFPSIEEMYPENDKGHWDFGILSNTLEGFYRPGHFDGVITIVKKFFDIVQPNKAYFGEKDFQQLAHIRQWVALEKRKEIIVSCPTLREPDGLAMSSRNLRLSTEDRALAAHIYRILSLTKHHKKKGSPQECVQWAEQEFLNTPGIQLEYFAIVDGPSFQPLRAWSDSNEPIALVAAYIRSVRLIDNLRLSEE